MFSVEPRGFSDLERPWRSFQLFETFLNPMSRVFGICSLWSD